MKCAFILAPGKTALFAVLGLLLSLLYRNYTFPSGYSLFSSLYVFLLTLRIPSSHLFIPRVIRSQKSLLSFTTQKG